MVNFRKFRYEEKELKIIHNSTLIGLSFFFFFSSDFGPKGPALIINTLEGIQKNLFSKTKTYSNLLGKFSSTLQYVLGEHQIKHTLKTPSLELPPGSRLSKGIYILEGICTNYHWPAFQRN